MTSVCGRVNTRYSTQAVIAELVQGADLVIGSVLIPGAAAPKLVSKEMISTMMPGSVIVDVAIDQGGALQRRDQPLTQSQPLCTMMLSYCVANMPGAVPRTSSLALNQATLPFVKRLAVIPEAALISDPHLRAGLATKSGHLTSKHVAEEHSLDWQPAEKVLN